MKNDIFIEYEGSSLDLSEPKLNSSPRALAGLPTHPICWSPPHLEFNGGVKRASRPKQLDPTYTGDIKSSVLKVKTTGKSNEGNKWNKVLGKSMHVHLQVGFAGLRSNDLVPKCNLQDHVVWKTTESSYSFAVAALLFLFLRCYYYCCCCGCCCCHFLTAPSCRETFSSHFPGLLLAPGTKQLSDGLSIRTTTHPPMLISKYIIYIYIYVYQIFTFHTFHATKRGQTPINFN